MKIIFLIFLCFWGPLWASNTEKLSNIKNIQRLAFGSCNNEVSYQNLWKDMIAMKPDLFIWGGDSIYAEAKSIEDLKKSYSVQAKIKDYLDFKAQTPMIGTWDDHDFSHNDADGFLSYKKESQKLFLDFLEVPENSPRRSQEGIYTSYEFGEENKKILIIILDNRYFLKMDRQLPLLGKTQWDWIEKTLKNSKAKLHFIVTGLSIFSPQTPFSEEWADFNNDFKKMMLTLNINKVPAVVFLTGDKHFSSILERQGHIEFLSSGLTHTIKEGIKRTFVRANYPNYTFDHSYGLIEITWTADGRPSLTLKARNEKSENALLKKFEWDPKKSWVKLN